MRKLRKSGGHLSPALSPTGGEGDGGTRRAGTDAPYQYARAAVVVPNGTLFGDGVCARIKEELLKEFNLHTIVRLPNGVFAPYTGIPTNILFFDRSGPTREIWYYEQPKRLDGNYSKSKPMQFEEFAECIAWFSKHFKNERTWKVPVSEIIAAGYNLDRRNPNATEDLQHQPPEKLVADIYAKEERILGIMSKIRSLLEAGK